MDGTYDSAEIMAVARATIQRESGVVATLSWNVSAGAQSYSLHFGTSDPPPLYASGLTATSQPLSALTPGTTYRWFVVAETPCGSTPSTGGTATFSTQCATQSARWPAKR